MVANKIFISYPAEDHLIAEAIADAITHLYLNKLDVFRDRIHIQGGANIPSVIENALKETVYFVGVGTNVLRRNFDWCGQELGFYKGSFPEETRKITCLYHLHIPDLFTGRVNHGVRSLKREHRRQFGEPVVAPSASPVWDFLKSVAQLNSRLHGVPEEEPDKYWNEFGAWAENYTKLITEVFFQALENRVERVWYPQARLEISIERGDFYKTLSDGPPDLPDDGEVRPTSQFYSLLKHAPPDPIETISWREMKDVVKESARNDIFTRMVADITVGVLPSRDDTKNDYIIQMPNQKFYRVLLVRHSVYGNGKREFIFNMIETLSKVMSGDSDTTTLAAGIHLGSKYRSLFHEEGSKYALEAFSDLSPEECASRVEQMLSDIDRVNADAAADGLANFENLERLLGNTQEIKSLFRSWWTTFPPMENAAKNLLHHPVDENMRSFLSEYGKFISMSRKNNTNFIRLCIDAYQRSIATASDLSSE